MAVTRSKDQSIRRQVLSLLEWLCVAAMRLLRNETETPDSWSINGKKSVLQTRQYRWYNIHCAPCGRVTLTM